MLAIKTVWFNDWQIYLLLNNDIEISSPIATFPNLRKGTPEQWNKFEIWDNGRWLHWEELDEDLSLEGFLKETNI